MSKSAIPQVFCTGSEVFVTLEYCRRGSGIVCDVNSSGTGGIDEDARGIKRCFSGRVCRVDDLLGDAFVEVKP